MRKFRYVLSIILLLLFALSGPTWARPPKYVFYFIGDGMGASQRQFSEFFLRETDKNPGAVLTMNTFEVAGLTATYAANTLITDSAAAATALATGVKTNKGYVGVSPRGKALITLTEAARDKGLATGIITTTRLTHATPASFTAHNLSRSNENDIAMDLFNCNVDFMAGGGIRHFLPKDHLPRETDITHRPIKGRRKDGVNLVQAFMDKGYAAFVGKKGAAAFKTTDFTRVPRAFIALTQGHLPFEIDRQNAFPQAPSLADLTRAGIQSLSLDPDGFFVMVEGGRIDHACHINDPVGTIHDVLALDRAVAQALEFARAHPDDTLILVVGDHETGGLGLGMDTLGYRLNMAALVPARISVNGNLSRGPQKYKGHRNAFLELIQSQYGLSQLTPGESNRLNTAMDLADAGKTSGYYQYDPVALATARLLSERANIHWTCTIHTATMIPLSATGVGANEFSGFKDNTQIARTLARVMGLGL